eukprot:GHVU01196206.1.p3 GENE.GHVU01196206.1~~GHVU01196206.1.p3  ORF type:complete len:219 (-),score=33.93 GHVU01196206.1:1282-1938(-)
MEAEEALNASLAFPVTASTTHGEAFAHADASELSAAGSTPGGVLAPAAFGTAAPVSVRGLAPPTASTFFLQRLGGGPRVDAWDINPMDRTNAVGHEALPQRDDDLENPQTGRPPPSTSSSSSSLGRNVGGTRDRPAAVSPDNGPSATNSGKRRQRVPVADLQVEVLLLQQQLFEKQLLHHDKKVELTNKRLRVLEAIEHAVSSPLPQSIVAAVAEEAL